VWVETHSDTVSPADVNKAVTWALIFVLTIGGLGALGAGALTSYRGLD
jgi:hypothetical protein